jgi:predicted RNA methylase
MQPIRWRDMSTYDRATTRQYHLTDNAIIQSTDSYEVTSADAVVFTMVDTLLIEDWHRARGIHSTK